MTQLTGEALEIAESLSLLAHDLRNPLAALHANLGFVRLFVAALDLARLPSEDEVAEAREAMVDAELACEALQRLVTNLDIVARDLVSRRPPEAQPLDLVALADEIVARHRGAAASRGLRVRVTGAAWGVGDRDNVARALDNVLANAIQYAPASSNVDIEIGARDGAVFIEVLDDGAAVPESLREDATSRRGQSRAKSDPDARYGRGLALYAAAAAARAGHGRLVLGERSGRSAIAISLARFEDGT